MSSILKVAGYPKPRTNAEWQSFDNQIEGLSLKYFETAKECLKRVSTPFDIANKYNISVETPVEQIVDQLIGIISSGNCEDEIADDIVLLTISPETKAMYIKAGVAHLEVALAVCSSRGAEIMNRVIRKIFKISIEDKWLGKWMNVSKYFGTAGLVVEIFGRTSPTELGMKIKSKGLAVPIEVFPSFQFVNAELFPKCRIPYVCTKNSEGKFIVWTYEETDNFQNVNPDFIEQMENGFFDRNKEPIVDTQLIDDFIDCFKRRQLAIIRAREDFDHSPSKLDPESEIEI